MADFALLDSNAHKHLTLEQDDTFAHARTHHMVQVTVHEVARLGASYPIVFVKDRDTGQFHLMAMLGLQPGENLFFSEDGWRATVVPQQFQSYPFSLTTTNDAPGNFKVVVDLAATVLGDKGEPLFSEDGQQAEALKAKLAVLSRSADEQALTRAFVNALAEKEVLSPQSLTVKLNNGESRNLTGLYVIDEEKLNTLTTEAYEALRQQRFIGACYACIHSLGRIDTLIRLQAERAAN